MPRCGSHGLPIAAWEQVQVAGQAVDPFKRYRESRSSSCCSRCRSCSSAPACDGPARRPAVVDRTLLARRAPIAVRRVHARARRLQPVGRLRLPGRREGRQQPARVAERASARRRSAQLSAHRGREPAAPASARAARPLRSETVSAQVIGKDTTEFFRVARVTLDRRRATSGPTCRCSRPTAWSAPAPKSAGDTVDVQLGGRRGFGVDVVVERTGARGFVRGTGDETQVLVQRRVRAAHRRGRGRRRAGHERLGQSLSQGPPGGARHQGREARLRHLPEVEADARRSTSRGSTRC